MNGLPKLNFLKNPLQLLFFLGVFFVPFNSYDGIPQLGEFSRESAFIFFFTGTICYYIIAVLRSKIVFPFLRKELLLLILFLIWCLITLFLNLGEISQNYFKSTTGINRFLRQYLVLLFIVIGFTSYFYYSISKKSFFISFIKIRKVFFLSFLIVTCYSIIEILILRFDQQSLLSLLNLFDFLPFVKVKLDYNYQRISSVSFEPPFLAIYLITVAGWMFSYLLTSKNIFKYLPGITVLILTVYSGSRTALVVVVIQLVVFLFLLMRSVKFRKYLIILSGVSILGITTITLFSGNRTLAFLMEKVETLDFKKNLSKSVSNKSRFGMQYANLKVFIENPLFGVGFGQQAFHNYRHYPDWALENNYEFKLFYLNQKHKPFPPGYNLYIRILAETGIIGTIFFLLFLILLVINLWRISKSSNKHEQIVSIVLIVSFAGFIINWMQIDTFRIFGFWICLALLIQLKNEKLSQNNE